MPQDRPSPPRRPLSAGAPLPLTPQRVLVAGTSGAGKSTLARQIAATLALPYVEIDGLFHGPGWTLRESFRDEVTQLVESDRWVTEWQYSVVREQLAERAELLVFLDLPRHVVMAQVIRRTLGRRLRRTRLWNANREPPLWTILTDPEHIIRWAWRTHAEQGPRVMALHARQPELTIVVLHSRAEISAWSQGPLAQPGSRPVQTQQSSWGS